MAAARQCAPRLIPLLLSILLFLHPSYAVSSDDQVPPYTRDIWAAEHGFPGTTVNAIAQTGDGYLWIGAENGLVRFDGLNFRLFNHANTPGLPPSPVLGLAADSEGDLWVRTQDPGLIRYREGAFHNVILGDLRNYNRVTAQTRLGNGEILFVAFVNHMFTTAHHRLIGRAFEISVPSFLVNSLAEGQDGTIWIGTRERGLYSLAKDDIRPILRYVPEGSITSL